MSFLGVFAAIKVFLSPETVRKFHPLSYGGSLAGELKDVGPQLPEAYGGEGKDLKSSGVTVKYASGEAVKAEPAAEPA
jgi:phosphatidylinositol transfer protein SFH5